MAFGQRNFAAPIILETHDILSGQLQCNSVAGFVSTSNENAALR
jgi:hypothetical protein